MSDEHKAVFESDDFYGPTMKLVVDCASPGAVSFIIDGSTTGVTASVGYTLYTDDNVLDVVGQLLDWLDREKKRRGG